jgi:glycosyltransferase involved in cell wall biosynthesis
MRQASKLRILLVHPGTQYAYRLAIQLHRKGLLYKFVSSFVIVTQSRSFTLLKWLPASLKRQISNRLLDCVPSANVVSLWWLDIYFFLVKRVNASAPSSVWFSKRNDLFQKRIPHKLLLDSDCVIGFDTSSRAIIQRARKLGKKFILDVSIAHPIVKERTYHFLKKNFPQWRQHLDSKPERLIRAEQEEMELADMIVVASSFTKRTLIESGITADKIAVNPYGIDTSVFKNQRKCKDNIRITFLFVGSIDVRKGIPLLLDIWEHFRGVDHAELLLVGPIEPEVNAYIRNKKFTNLQIIGKVPFCLVQEYYHTADVLIFPSFFEGFAQVILEAMACGMTVITTPYTAGPDIIDSGYDGYIIDPVNGPEEFVDLMRQIVDGGIDHISIGQRASEKAARYTWDVYGERWNNIVHELVNLDKSV